MRNIYNEVYLKMIYEDAVTPPVVAPMGMTVDSSQLIQLGPYDNPVDIFLQAKQQSKNVKCRIKLNWDYITVIVKPLKMMADSTGIYATITDKIYRAVKVQIVSMLNFEGPAARVPKDFTGTTVNLKFKDFPCFTERKDLAYVDSARVGALQEKYPNLPMFYYKTGTNYFFVKPLYLLCTGYVRVAHIQQDLKQVSSEQINVGQQKDYLTPITYKTVYEVVPFKSRLQTPINVRNLIIKDGKFLDQRINGGSVQEVFPLPKDPILVEKETVENVSSMPIQDACQSWGTLNGMSDETAKLFNAALVAHNQDMKEHPQNHNFARYKRGANYEVNDCDCGFHYEVDSSD